MEKEQIIKALYDAKSDASAQEAHGQWLAYYQKASEPDKEYLYNEYLKFGQHLFERGEQSNREIQEVLAEYENWKLETNQH